MGTNILWEIMQLIEASRKNGDTETVKHLKTIYGDLQRINLDCISKLEFTLWLKAQFKSIETAKEKAEKVGIYYDPDHDYLNILAELEYRYALPQLTESRIREYFAGLIANNPNLNKGQLMRALKDEYEGFYDGKLAAQVAGEFNKATKYD